MSYKYKCRLPTCGNKHYPHIKDSGKHFFAFPKNTKVREKWFEAINHNLVNKIFYSDTKLYLCSHHFSDSNYTSTFKNRLNKFAVPKIFTVKVTENLALLVSQTIDDDDISKNTNSSDNLALLENANNDIPSISLIDGCSNELSNCNLSLSPTVSFNTVNSTIKPELLIDDSDKSPNLITWLSVSKPLKRKERNGDILAKINCSKACLSPRKKQMYNLYRKQQSTVSKLKLFLSK